MVACGIHSAGSQAACALNCQGVAFCFGVAAQGLEHGTDGFDSVGFFCSQLAYAVKSRGSFGVGGGNGEHGYFVYQSRDFLGAYISGEEAASLGFNAS